MVTEVAVARLRAFGERVYEHAALSPQDAATVDAVQLDADLRGVIPAVGGYKGTGLSIMMNVLAGVLPGGYHTEAVDVGKRGQLFLVLSPALFGDSESFLDEIESMVSQIRTSELLPSVEELILAWGARISPVPAAYEPGCHPVPPFRHRCSHGAR
jgi:LDH2 family malate/lactate/ureidoglycolate dehydrogenase